MGNKRPYASEYAQPVFLSLATKSLPYQEYNDLGPPIVNHFLHIHIWIQSSSYLRLTLHMY